VLGQPASQPTNQSTNQPTNPLLWFWFMNVHQTIVLFCCIPWI
jgi:hypothetical protein